MMDIMAHKDTEAYQSCLPWHFHIVVFVVGMFFHCLNSFWMYKIIRKVMRKLSGAEKVQDNNQLVQNGDKKQN